MSSKTTLRVGLGTLAWIAIWTLAACGDDAPHDDALAGAGDAPATESPTGGKGAIPIGGAPAESAVKICGNTPERSVCDPVTAAPCDVLAGETCDFLISTQSFACIPGPNPIPPGGVCDTRGNFCGPTASCNVKIQRCQHYCCEDADCVEGACQTAYRVDGDAAIGVCLDEYRDTCQAGAGGAADEGCGGASGKE